jgi:peptide subunit release factor RF-3
MDKILQTLKFNFHGINVPVEVRQSPEGKYVFFNEKTKQYRTAFRRSLKRHLITHNKQRAKAKALLLMNCKFRNLLWEQQITLLEDNMDDDTPCVYWME